MWRDHILQEAPSKSVTTQRDIWARSDTRQKLSHLLIRHQSEIAENATWDDSELDENSEGEIENGQPGNMDFYAILTRYL